MKDITKSYAVKRIAELIEENNELKQENIDLKDLLKEKKLDKHKLKSDLIKEVIENHMKDRIEFAIAELEKVKDLLNHNYIIYGWIPLEVLENKVLKLINDLKEQKNELQDNV